MQGQAEQIFAGLFGSSPLNKLDAVAMIMTVTPNATVAVAGRFRLAVGGSDETLSEQAAGKTKACNCVVARRSQQGKLDGSKEGLRTRAEAANPPVSSKTMPRSQVTSDTAIPSHAASAVRLHQGSETTVTD